MLDRMSVPTKRGATYQDVLDAPAHQVAELIGGDLYLQPRPAAPHTLASSALGMILGSAFHRGVGGPGGWFLLDEPELHLGGDVLVPDIGGWRRDSGVEPELRRAFFTTAPGWVLEVLSPSTGRKDRALKMPRYHCVGVEHVWLVDPAARTLEVYRHHPAGYLLALAAGAADRVHAEPFETLAVELAELWSAEAEEGGGDARQP